MLHTFQLRVKTISSMSISMKPSSRLIKNSDQLKNSNNEKVNVLGKVNMRDSAK